VSELRRQTYRAARLMGDVDAALKGPVPLAKRIGRKWAYRKWNGLLRQMLRSVKL
jgi:hypothetical protein